MRVEDAPNQKSAGFPRVLPDRCECGRAKPAEEHIVVADDGYVSRDGASGSTECADCAQGNEVAGGDHAVKAYSAFEQTADGRFGRLKLKFDVANQGRIKRQPRMLQSVLIAPATLHGLGISTANERDPAATKACEVGGRSSPAGQIVGSN